MEPIRPQADENSPDRGRSSGRRSSIRQRVGVGVLVIVALLAMALLVDYGREAAAGDDLVPWEAGLDRGTQVAQATGKPMLLNFTADWCGPCQQMKRTVFSQPHVAETISEHFVPVKIDMTTQRPGSPETRAAERYGVPALPAYVVLDGEGEPISARLGQQSENDMLTWLESVR